MLVASASVACAGTNALPSVDSGATEPANASGARARAVPEEPKAAWHLEPNGGGVAVELRF
jgi:hypothetical protein